MVSDLNAARLSAEACSLIVVKVGSSLLVEPDGLVRRKWLKTLVADIAVSKAEGQNVIIVSSGAIALGARRLDMEKGGRASLADAQAAASVGQIILAGLWAELLGAEGLTAAQMLVTLDDLEDRRRYLNITATLERLLGAGAIPVINENDSVATEEIRFGDNDRLAARIAQAAGANAVVLLSDVDGLYDRNPKQAGAAIISEVSRIDARIRAMVEVGSSSGMGSGGMASKLEAAEIATRAGIGLAIASGLRDHPLKSLAGGAAMTWFVPKDGANARKSWLGGRQTVKGQIVVDAGAAKALKKGGSLLPAGAIRVAGSFQRGDVVDICSEAGVAIARGLAEHEAPDAKRICGKRSSQLEAILGPVPRNVLVHRDHMVLL